jgi:hypothetical protein
MHVLWCAGGKCDMVGSDEDCGTSRRPGAEDRGWSSTGWIPCTRRHGAWVSWLSLKIKVDGLLVVWPQNP